VLIMAPWRWHHGFAEQVRPMLIRQMRWYAAGLLAFGALLLYCLLAAASRIAA
jgi:hypothetical protein